MSAVLAVAALAAVGCTDDENDNYQGNWVKCDTHFPGTQRGGAVCFKIGEEAYVGTGYNSNELGAQTRFRDFYKFDGKAWTQVPSMPSDTLARDGGVAFAINGKGYVGLGSTGTRFLNDFWCFDPQTQTWSRVADFPRRDGIEDYQSYERRRYAVAFVIDNVAYVGSGEDIDGHAQSDFYKFDGTTWTPIAGGLGLRLRRQGLCGVRPQRLVPLRVPALQPGHQRVGDPAPHRQPHRRVV